MKTQSSFPILITFVAFLFVAAGCNSATKTEEKPSETASPDMAQIHKEIQAVETEWASAMDAKDTARVMAIYAEDAVEMNSGIPMLTGKPAIKQELIKSLAEIKPGTVTAYETLDVFGDADLVTETGKITIKDGTGKVIKTGKYIGIFAKQDGKYRCIRDINNFDEKER
jgi:uncharacterized protein (TIGR02246 family)